MNNKSKIYVLVLIWGAAILQLFINSAIDREEKMVEQVVYQEEDNLYESSVKIYGYYGDDNLSYEAKDVIVKNLAKKLGIVSGYEVATRENNGNNTTVLTKLGKHGDTEIKVISLVGEDEYGQQVTENYIMINIDLKGSAGAAAYDYKEQLVEIYEGLGIKPSTNVYLCSQVKGFLTETEIKNEITEFMEIMDAYVVEDVVFDDVRCVYGYSKNIDEFVYQNDERVNVNIAFTYDKENDVTYIHRAVPFVDKSF